MIRNLIRFGFVPFMILGLNGLAFLVVAQGWSYLWLAPLLLSAIAFTFGAERIAPNHVEWNDDQHDTQTNVFHAIVYEIQNINGVLLIPLIVWLLPSFGVWPTDWPLIAQLVLAVVLADFAFMVIHMLSHKYAILWRLHAVHHGVSRLYGFNGLVRHPLHQMLDMLIGTLPLVLMGMPTDVAVLLGFVIAVQLTVQHANVAYVLGPFKNVMSIGQLHHLHHVNWGTEGDCNFGLFLTLWDRMFGTFNPNPPRTIGAYDMGIDDVPNFPKTYWEQLWFPLVYKPGQGAAAVDRRTTMDGPTPAE